MVSRVRPKELAQTHSLGRVPRARSIIDSYNETRFARTRSVGTGVHDEGSDSEPSSPKIVSASWVQEKPRRWTDQQSHVESESPFAALARERRNHWKQANAKPPNPKDEQQLDHFPEAGISKKLRMKLDPTSPTRSIMAGMRHHIATAIHSIHNAVSRSASSTVLRPQGLARSQTSPELLHPVQQAGAAGGDIRCASSSTTPTKRTSQLPFTPARTPTATPLPPTSAAATPEAATWATLGTLPRDPRAWGRNAPHDDSPTHDRSASEGGLAPPKKSRSWREKRPPGTGTSLSPYARAYRRARSHLAVVPVPDCPHLRIRNQKRKVLSPPTLTGVKRVSGLSTLEGKGVPRA